MLVVLPLAKEEIGMRLQKLIQHLRFRVSKRILTILIVCSAPLVGQTPPPSSPAAPSPVQPKRPVSRRPTAPKKKVIEANEFLLKDAAGVVRGRFTIDDTTPMFSLLDKDGKERIRLAVRGDGPTVSLLDVAGQSRTELQLLAE